MTKLSDLTEIIQTGQDFAPYANIEAYSGEDAITTRGKLARHREHKQIPAVLTTISKLPYMYIGKYALHGGGGGNNKVILPDNVRKRRRKKEKYEREQKIKLTEKNI